MAAAIVTSIENDYIYLALEDADGFPIVMRCAFGALDTFEIAYQPGAGSACNAKQGPSDTIFFYGNFGTDITVIRHTVSTNTNDDISPPSLGAKVVNALDVNPEDILEIWATVNTDKDLLMSDDGGASWSTINAALGIDATDLRLLWPDSTKIMISGNTGSETRFLYSDTAGVSFTDVASVALHGSANISAFDVII